MTTYFYCVEISQGHQVYKKDGTITSDDLNLHSAKDVIDHIKDSHTPKTQMGNAIGTAVLVAFNKI